MFLIQSWHALRGLHCVHPFTSLEDAIQQYRAGVSGHLQNSGVQASIQELGASYLRYRQELLDAVTQDLATCDAVIHLLVYDWLTPLEQNAAPVDEPAMVRYLDSDSNVKEARTKISPAS